MNVFRCSTLSSNDPCGEVAAEQRKRKREREGERTKSVSNNTPL
jgi:hypothetical protein